MARLGDKSGGATAVLDYFKTHRARSPGIWLYTANAAKAVN